MILLPLEHVTVELPHAAAQSYVVEAHVAAPVVGKSLRYEVRGRALHVWPAFRYESGGSSTVRFLLPAPGRVVNRVEIENVFLHHVGEIGNSTSIATLVAPAPRP